MDISKLTFAVFTIAESGHCFAGYHDPSQSWNGWACPTFPQHEVERMRVLWGEDPDDEEGYGLAAAIADTGLPHDAPYLPVGSHGWTWEVVDLPEERSYFLQPIRTFQQAEAFILRLDKDGLVWHFDDAPDTIINGTTRKALFTDAEAAAAVCRVDELFEVMGDPFGLPVALINAEGGKVFRVNWVEGYREHDGTHAYLTTDELTEDNGYSQKYCDQGATLAVGQTISMAGVLDVATLTRLA